MRPVALLLLAGSAVQAATVVDLSPATDLIGSLVTVTHFGGAGMSSATFVAAAGGAVIASDGPVGFKLEVTAGDTKAATWTLTNTDPAAVLLNHITSVNIDLSAAGKALFDRGTVPSTPGSLDGIDGVTPVAGAAAASGTELNPWLDAANAGDLYTAVRIAFLSGGIAPLAASSWQDDTDSLPVPEPATSLLLAAGALLVGGAVLGKRRRVTR